MDENWTSDLLVNDIYLKQLSYARILNRIQMHTKNSPHKEATYKKDLKSRQIRPNEELEKTLRWNMESNIVIR